MQKNIDMVKEIIMLICFFVCIIIDIVCLNIYRNGWIMTSSLGIIGLPVIIKVVYELFINNEETKIHRILGYYVPSFIFILISILSVIFERIYLYFRWFELWLFPFFHYKSFWNSKYSTLIIISSVLILLLLSKIFRFYKLKYDFILIAYFSYLLLMSFLIQIF